MNSEKSSLTTETPDVKKVLKKVGLDYTADTAPGISRRKKGSRFAYVNPHGKSVNALGTLKRIAALVIPPAWRDVWICANESGHLQATGRDAKGRKQYRYHADFRAHRDETKFHRMVDFAETLPSLRRKIQHDLALTGLPASKILATVVQLLEKTLIRVGNEEYAKSNKSYGLTTIQDKHVKPIRDGIRFSFIGKSGVAHNVEVSDKRLCKIVLQSQDLPGQHLFQYLDDNGKRHSVNSNDVNSYIRQISGKDYSAKDFRTWRGTVLATMALERIGYEESATKRKKNVASIVKDVAEELRNRPATCRKYYIHPSVLTAYDEGNLLPLLKRSKKKAQQVHTRNLSIDEQTVLYAIQHLEHA